MFTGMPEHAREGNSIRRIHIPPAITMKILFTKLLSFTFCKHNAIYEQIDMQNAYRHDTPCWEHSPRWTPIH